MNAKDFSIKVYDDAQTRELNQVLTALGEKPVSEEHITRAAQSELIGGNSLPAYAEYSDKKERWILKVAASTKHIVTDLADFKGEIVPRLNRGNVPGFGFAAMFALPLLAAMLATEMENEEVK